MATFDIPGDDDALRSALEDVNLPTLLMVLTQFAGDDRWLSDRYKPDPIMVPEGELFPDDTGNYSDEVALEIRDAALGLIRTLRDEGAELPQAPSKERMQQMMEFSTAESVDADFCSMLLEETRFVDRDESWKKLLRQVSEEKRRDFQVIVVGAGMSGICTGIKLKEAGISFTILEKNDAVGGTWYENTYPDCGVDTPNHFYSYSFERNPNWSGYFSKRDELHSYFEHCVDKYGLRENISLSSEVRKMRLLSATGRWEVTVADSNGDESTLSANAVVSAVGQLNRPVVPEF
ncbi:MAG TPA: monooxygenase, partial [Gammaproteobacteria bacterium]|nr:monooxygenase [Gammaproteobacteria bacterium]